MEHALPLHPHVTLWNSPSLGKVTEAPSTVFGLGVHMCLSLVTQREVWSVLSTFGPADFSIERNEQISWKERKARITPAQLRQSDRWAILRPETGCCFVTKIRPNATHWFFSLEVLPVLPGSLDWIGGPTLARTRVENIFSFTIEQKGQRGIIFSWHTNRRKVASREDGNMSHRMYTRALGWKCENPSFLSKRRERDIIFISSIGQNGNIQRQTRPVISHRSDVKHPRIPSSATISLMAVW